MGNAGKILFALVSSICLTALHPVVASAAGGNGTSSGKKLAELPRGLDSALVEGVAALASSRLQYSVNRVRTSPNKELRPDRIDTELEECVLDRGRWYYREELRAANRAAARPMIREVTYDGHTLIMGSRRGLPDGNDARPRPAGRPSLTKFLGDNIDDPRVTTEVTNVPYLEAIGFPVPETIAAWRTTKLHSYVQWCLGTGTLLNVSQEGALWILELEVPDQTLLRARATDLNMIKQSMPNSTPESLDRYMETIRNAQALAPIRIVKMSLNSERNFAMERREERTYAGELIRTTESSDFTSYANGRLWLPKTCVACEFFRMPHLLSTHSAEPVTTATITLDTISFDDPGKTSFSLDYGPDQLIADRSTKEAASEPSGRVIVRPPSRAISTPNEAVKAPKRWSLWWIMGITNAALVVVIVTLFGRRWLSRNA